MDCLQDIIGLSETACDCILPEGSGEAEFSTSKSGIYLDRLEGFNIVLAKGSDDCANGDIWTRMAQARADAMQDYRNDLMGCVARNHQPRYNNFKGQLGQSSFKATVNPGKPYAGMRISPTLMKGGYMYLNKIGIIVNQSVPVTVEVYSDQDDSTLIFSSTINATADIITWATIQEDGVDTPLELPMWSQNGGYIKYYVLLLLDGTFLPKNNKSSCGCGTDNKKAYQNWASFNGAHGTDIADLNTFGTTNDLVLNGVAVNVDFKCKVSEIICSDEMPPDYLNDGNAINMAYAIRFKAGVRLYEQLYSSDQINRFTLLNRDHVIAKIKEWSEIYARYIDDTCKNTTRLFENDCLICRDTQNTVLKRNYQVA